MAIETNPFDHILYEFSMYLNAMTVCSNKQFITNLLVDSRMVHMRNLAYFFCSDQDKGKNYFHYRMFISGILSQEIDHTLFSEIQRITSNSTCHLLKGRLNESFKQEAAKFEKSVFPLFASLIREFIVLLNQSDGGNYSSEWADENIQENATGILKLIDETSHSDGSYFAIITTE